MGQKGNKKSSTEKMNWSKEEVILIFPLYRIFQRSRLTDWLRRSGGQTERLCHYRAIRQNGWRASSGEAAVAWSRCWDAD